MLSAWATTARNLEKLLFLGTVTLFTFVCHTSLSTVLSSCNTLETFRSFFLVGDHTSGGLFR